MPVFQSLSQKLVSRTPHLNWADPIIINPRRNDHQHTIILLHDLNQTAEPFMRDFLDTTKIPHDLSTVRFIFPTAKADTFGLFGQHKGPNQWFRVSDPYDPNVDADGQIPGLKETSGYLRVLIAQEARRLEDLDRPSKNRGYDRVIIGGLGQGAAAALFTLLGMEHTLGGFVGMGGWLPFEGEMAALIREAGAVPVEKGRSMKDENSIKVQIQKLVRGVLDVETVYDPQSVLQLETPIFLGHGDQDRTTWIGHGHRMREVLDSWDGLGMTVIWKEYHNFGHCWKPYGKEPKDHDVIKFLRLVVGVHARLF